MIIPEPIQLLYQQLTQELEDIKQLAMRGLKLLQPLLSLFENNATILRYYAYFNNSLFLVEISRGRIQAIIEFILSDRVTDEDIQEAGEELGEILGRILETKIEVNRIIKIIE